MGQQTKRKMQIDVFMLAMILYGFTCMFSEMLPKIEVGVITLSVEYLLFVPFSIAILLQPLAASLGAATGELVFSEILLGSFGGITEFSKFARIAFCVWLCGVLVRNPNSRRQVGLASIFAVIVDQSIHYMVNVTRVLMALHSYDPVPGLPDSVFVVEGVSCLTHVLLSGILFCMLPTMILVPKLYGKVEPLLGRQPRIPGEKDPDRLSFQPRMILLAVLVFGLALGCKIVTKLLGV